VSKINLMDLLGASSKGGHIFEQGALTKLAPPNGDKLPNMGHTSQNIIEIMVRDE